MGHEKKRARAKRHAAGIFIGAVVLVGAIVLFLQHRVEAGLIGVQFKLPNGSLTSHFKLEVASDSASRRKGLMFRREMADDRGMLFVFPQPQKLSFYMKNTYLPLDMIFLDEENVVVGVLHDVPPLNERSRSVDAQSMFVIELNAGLANRIGITPGAKALYDTVLPKGIP
ncbi:MAG: DUF192 domain-containing protein [Bdellovibrionales bacterium]|nr:DUF192 domain-containing protein [Bdellovibrionales bacterium]